MGQALRRARFLQPGDKLGKHDLIRQIAVGGMAELYLARTVGIEGFEKLAVVKRILPQYATNASFVHMFLNEARLAATFQHPNIAQVYDIGQEQGEFFFSMEYVHGEDLGRLVATSFEQGIPISLDAALTLVTGLCAGLHHAHEKVSPDGKPLNVVHRDVSPSNVLVSYDGAVKLVDFGIARVNSTPSSTAGGLKGKISYMSPEQCRGKATLDRRSDVFSVGTILYELTTGQLPFTDETEYGVLNQIVNRDAEPPSKLVPGYPPALEAIVVRSLARDPDQRYASARELQGALEDFALENRLRVSALVLARLMSTLFPQRLEEWDHARAQGAFFVEQHVVRTLIESGKTGESATLAAPDDASGPHVDPALPPVAGETAQFDDDGDSTAVTEPPIVSEADPTRIRPKTPLPVSVEPPPRAPSQPLLPGVHERAKTPLPRAQTPLPGHERAKTPLPGVHERPTTQPPVHQRAATPATPLPGVHERAPTPLPGVHERVPTPFERPASVPPTRATTPYPEVAPPAFMPPQPGAVPIYVPLPPPQAGTLVSNAAVPSPAMLKVGDVTERVRVPTPVAIVRKSKTGMLVLVIAVAGAAVAALVTYFVLASGDAPPQLATSSSEPTTLPEPKTEPKTAPAVETEPAKTEPAKTEPAKTEPAKTEPAKTEPVKTEPAKIEPAPEPVPEVKADVRAEPVPKPVPPPPTIKREPEPPKPVAVAKPDPKKPKVTPKPKPKVDPAKKPDKKPDTKEPQWNDDSPFMPVRTDKK